MNALRASLSAASLAPPLAWPHDRAFALQVAARAAGAGLTYTSATGAQPIAVALPQEAEPDAAVAQRAHIARVVLTALTKVAAVHGAELVLGLSPAERAAALAARSASFRLVTARADILIDTGGVPRVLEMNTTIPAMQGYSDIALRAWMETAVERWTGWPAARAAAVADAVLGDTGSNADDLLRALLAAYAADGGSKSAPSIGIVHRTGDSQAGELGYLARHFAARGHAAFTASIDDVTADSSGRLVANGRRADVWYRHIFGRLVPPGSPFLAALADAGTHHVYNPLAAHLEQKAALAILSRAAADDGEARALGLSDEERSIVNAHVPWTRVLDAHLQEHVAAQPHALVIKKSWDSGGKSVQLGDLHADSWPERVAQAVREGGWVVQERVAFSSSETLVAGAGHVATRAVYTDASAYTGFGIAHCARGGVRRASTSPVVNIQSGGGVMPLVTQSLLRSLRSACGLGPEHPSDNR